MKTGKMQLIQKINSATDRPHYREKIRKQPIVETCSAESSGIARYLDAQAESDLFDRVKIKYSGNVCNFRLSTTSISRIFNRKREICFPSFLTIRLSIFFFIDKYYVSTLRYPEPLMKHVTKHPWITHPSQQSNIIKYTRLRSDRYTDGKLILFWLNFYF